MSWEIARQSALVRKVIAQHNGLQELLIHLGDEDALAYNLLPVAGEARTGDLVEVNTTAGDLRLGSGGHHWVLGRQGISSPVKLKEPGHIIKLRYTPMQLKVLAVEEEASPYHRVFKEKDSLEGCPVVVAELHSQLPAVAAAAALTWPGCRVVYCMTDGGALPLALSKLAAQLQEKKLLAGTVTMGHAFGGDLESVNLYSGLLAARWILGADIIVVAMGPGTVGTGTVWGSTALEQAPGLDGVNALGGRAIAVARLSFADQRPRHQGLSHHTATSLGRLCYSPVLIGLPPLNEAEQKTVDAQLKTSGITEKHRVLVRPDPGINDFLAEQGIALESMGRSFAEDPVFFQAAAACGVLAAEMASGLKLGPFAG